MIMQEFSRQRKELVQGMLQRGALKSKNVKQAFLSVKREEFFPQELLRNAYVDSAFPIGYGQTISQPSTIGIMLELLEVRKGQKVLEIGAGCGYVLALLSELVGKKGSVFGVDLVEELAGLSAKNLANAGYGNIAVRHGDGRQSWLKEAPFDRILVSAACNEIPAELVEQLAAAFTKVLLPRDSLFSCR